MKIKSLAICAMVSSALLAAGGSLCAAPLKARVIQQYFAQDRKGLDESFEWTIAELKKCDESLDIIVLPEFCEVPGKTSGAHDFLATSRRNGVILIETCAETAKRCNSLVFAGVVDHSLPVPRNAIFAFDRQGKVVGKYYKEHLTRGEWDKLDKSYTEDWTRPYMIEIEGVKYMFLICYDFYFYENYANLARWKPDIIIGSSHQRSDTFRAHDIINSFLAYHTGAYLVRSSVSMGLDSKLAGCSCVVAPTGEILGVLRSEIDHLDVTFDPSVKYLKPAGYGNPPAMHSEYIEIGRRPWKYRPAGSAIVTPISEAPAKRLCADGGQQAGLKAHSMAAYGAAVGAGAPEIGITLWNGPEGPVAGLSEDAGTARLENILRKFSSHTLMNITLAGDWTDEALRKVRDEIFIYDCVGYVYYTSSDASLLGRVARIDPAAPRCFVASSCGTAADEALAAGCQMVRLPSEGLNVAVVDKVHAAGLRAVAPAGDASAATKLFGMGVDTVITADYLAASGQ